jgi:hypothetical protein
VCLKRRGDVFRHGPGGAGLLQREPERNHRTDDHERLKVERLVGEPRSDAPGEYGCDRGERDREPRIEKSGRGGDGDEEKEAYCEQRLSAALDRKRLALEEQEVRIRPEPLDIRVVADEKERVPEVEPLRQRALSDRPAQATGREDRDPMLRPEIEILQPRSDVLRMGS